MLQPEKYKGSHPVFSTVCLKHRETFKLKHRICLTPLKKENLHKAHVQLKKKTCQITRTKHDENQEAQFNIIL